MVGTRVDAGANSAAQLDGNDHLLGSMRSGSPFDAIFMLSERAQRAIVRKHIPTYTARLLESAPIAYELRLCRVGLILIYDL